MFTWILVGVGVSFAFIVVAIVVMACVCGARADRRWERLMREVRDGGRAQKKDQEAA